MNNLRITDNHEFIRLDSAPNSWYWHNLLNGNAEKDLELISNVQIGKLSINNNPNLLVFPRDFHGSGDDIGESCIISKRNNEISTSNIMGFVGVNETQLDIKSRFAKEDSNDYFLHYMLQKVFSINLFDIKHSFSQEPIFDFLLYLFPSFLKKALAQGLFKKYRKYKYNDFNIRGPIDINRHIRENIPFKGTVAYSTREHSCDNEVSQLIRHTIEYIRTKEIGEAILNSDIETRECVSLIAVATPTYNSRERNRIINQNIKPIQHPYYSAYTSLQKICIQILRHDSIKYGMEKDKVYGVLFDGAWLWEEYLNSVLQKSNPSITHAKNKTGENGISLYKGGKKCYYPDFYRKAKNDDSGDRSFVLDAKYKKLGNDVRINVQEVPMVPNTVSIGRDDLFQMITYMHVLPAKHCALLYPIERNEPSTIHHIVESSKRELEGFGGEIKRLGIRVSNQIEYRAFCKEMYEIEKELLTILEDWMSQ